MKQFTYAITDPIGIHARPAGMLAQLAKSFADSTVTLTKGDQTVKATQLMKLMKSPSASKAATKTRLLLLLKHS